MEVLHHFGRAQLIGVQGVQQPTAELVSRVGNRSVQDVIQPGACRLNVGSRLRQPGLQRSGAHVVLKRDIAQDLLQSRQQVPQVTAVANGVKHTVEQRLVGQCAIRLPQKRLESRGHVGRAKRAEWMRSPVAAAEPRVSPRFSTQRVQHTLFLVRRESAHVAIEDNSQWVALDQQRSVLHAVHRHPSVHAAQGFDDSSVTATHQGEYSTQRQPSLDAFRHRSSCKELGDGAVQWKSSFAVGDEELAAKYDARRFQPRLRL